jgi:hypothetical protein
MPSIISQILGWLKAVLTPDNAFIIALAAVASIVAILEYFHHPTRRAISNLRNLWRMLKQQPTIPRNTILIRPHDHRLLWSFPLGSEWHSTLLNGVWQFTNITDRTIFLVSAKITSPRKARTIGRFPQGEPVPLPPDQDLHNIPISFIIRPSVHKRGKPYKATIVFIDHFHNEYIVRNNIFRPPDPHPG